ncbi:hypothetical protein BDZ89DRAFT_1064261 [Hymenopellis radicata]|nr:hypothetical protein BDZ89DRAFT_1064261 [Hymenopellis radicata]
MADDQASIISAVNSEPTTKKSLKVYRFRHSQKHTGWKHVKVDDTKKEWAGHHTKPSDSIKLRIRKALELLQFTIFECQEDSPGPCVIHLQEINRQGFDALREHEWIRNHFGITPRGPEKWPGPHQVYGNVTLIEKSIPIYGVAIYNFGPSTQERTAIQLDVRLRGLTLRLINTHLESMSGPQHKWERMRQLKECEKMVKKVNHGGLIAGDVNAIDADFDDNVRALGLRDAALETGELGHTWGDQSPPHADIWPRGRLDRLLYHSGAQSFKVRNIDTIGVGLRYENVWVSDHFGLVADIMHTRPESRR